MGKQLRRKRAEGDESADTAAAPPPPRAKAASAGPKLSFDPDEEGPLVKLKKKKKKSHAARERAAEEAEGPLGLATGCCSYSAEYLQALRGQQLRSAPPKASEADAAEPVEAADAVGFGAPTEQDEPPGEAEAAAPDEAAIRAARAQRERSRRAMEEGSHALSGPSGADYIPLDGKGGGAGSGGGRLVREAHEDDDDDGVSHARPRTFSRPLGPAGIERARPRAGGRFAATVVEVEEDEEERAPVGEAEGGVLSGQGWHRSRGESATAAAGTARGAAVADSSEAFAACAARLSKGSLKDETSLPSRLAAEQRRLEEQLKEQEREGSRVQLQLEASGISCGEIEESLRVHSRHYELLQRVQAYTEDLLACLSAKAPHIEHLEEDLIDAYANLFARQQAAQEALVAAERARAQHVLQCVLPGWAPPPLHSRLASGAVEPEGGAEGAALLLGTEEVRRGRRAAARTAARQQQRGAEAEEGWSSEDEEDLETALAQLGGEGAAGGGGLQPLWGRVRAVQAEAAALLADASSEFTAVKTVRKRFAQWRQAHARSYDEAFIELCLPTILAPLVRLELMDWDPLRAGSVEELRWYRELLSAASGAAEGAAEGEAEAELSLLAALSCKLALPRLKHALAHLWDVHSYKQSCELVQGIRELSAAAQALVAAGAEGGEAAAQAQAAAAALRELLMQAAMRLEAAVEEACVPPCLALAHPPSAAATEAAAAERVAAAAAAAARRQLWRALKLLRNIAEWSELLANAALQELMGLLLTRHALPFLRAHLACRPPRWELPLAACDLATAAVPAHWRRRDATGALAMCTAPLHAFVADELLPALPPSLAGGLDAPAKQMSRVKALLGLH